LWLFERARAMFEVLALVCSLVITYFHTRQKLLCIYDIS
jgi:hypothetical protein